jgi:hypothetical protein
VVKLGEHKMSGERVAVKIMRLPANGMLRGAHAMRQSKARPRAVPLRAPRTHAPSAGPCPRLSVTPARAARPRAPHAHAHAHLTCTHLFARAPSRAQLQQPGEQNNHSGKIAERPSLQEAAEIDEEDVFKEIEILKSLDQCAPAAGAAPRRSAAQQRHAQPARACMPAQSQR